MSGRACARADCRGGHIMVTGFCDTCFRRPLAPEPTATPPDPDPDPAGPDARGPRPAQGPGAPAAGELDRDGLLVLPHLPS
ncbi:protein kinase, partial [Streptomyces sp. ME02-6987-2C]|nr:protein kinase [Streptomyces sp. ME02-6987-2C]